MVRKVGMREWHDMALRGEGLPLRIPVDGVSMYPLVRRRVDRVMLAPLPFEAGVGDIVLFRDPGGERYVLHRIWERDGDRVLTWGDNCDGPDGWIPIDLVWGKATLIERGKRRIRPDPKRGMRHAKAWHPVGRILRKMRRIASRAYHALRRMAGKGPEKGGSA